MLEIVPQSSFILYVATGSECFVMTIVRCSDVPVGDRESTCRYAAASLERFTAKYGQALSHVSLRSFPRSFGSSTVFFFSTPIVITASRLFFFLVG